MAIQRKISKNKYILAFFLASIIFVLGLSLGMLFDDLRLKWADLENKKQEVDYLSLQFQYLYLTSLQDTNESCSVLRTTMEISIRDLSESLKKFEEYKESTRINNKDYELVGRKYILDNFKYWLFAKKTKEKCDLNVVNMLYFYSSNNCQNCQNQGVILTYFKKIYEDKLLIFPIDVDYEEIEPVITMFKNQYGITVYPTLIIEDKKYEGIVNSEELKEIIQDAFEHEEEISN